MKLDDIISLRDAADALGITATTLRAQAAQGRFEARNIPGLGWITTHQAVERYRAERLGRVGRPIALRTIDDVTPAELHDAQLKLARQAARENPPD